MRNREVIEREMYRAREDLEHNIAELKHAVQDKIDVKARARVAIAKGKAAAEDAIERGKSIASELAHRGKDGATELANRGKDGAIELYGKAKERPALVGAIAGGLIAAGALAYIGRQKNWW